MDPSKYDPNAIMLAAEAKREQQDLHGAHMMFESALLDWADDAREGSIDPDQMKEAIATLWLGYADFHKTSKMVRDPPVLHIGTGLIVLVPFAPVFPVPHFHMHSCILFRVPTKT